MPAPLGVREAPSLSIWTNASTKFNNRESKNLFALVAVSLVIGKPLRYDVLYGFGLRTEAARDIEHHRIADQYADPGGTASIRKWLSLRAIASVGEARLQCMIKVFGTAINSSIFP